MRQKIFISYSHEDREWRNHIEMALKQVTYIGDMLDIWSDEQIKPGREWENEIAKAIKKARIALLLVTPNFFRSQYIGTKELIDVLMHNRYAGLDIWWIPCEETNDTIRAERGIEALHAAHNPAQPLSELIDRPRAYTRAGQYCCRYYTPSQASGPHQQGSSR